MYPSPSAPNSLPLPCQRYRLKLPYLVLGTNGPAACDTPTGIFDVFQNRISRLRARVRRRD